MVALDQKYQQAHLSCVSLAMLSFQSACFPPFRKDGLCRGEACAVLYRVAECFLHHACIQGSQTHSGILQLRMKMNLDDPISIGHGILVAASRPPSNDRSLRHRKFPFRSWTSIRRMAEKAVCQNGSIVRLVSPLATFRYCRGSRRKRNRETI